VEAGEGATVAVAVADADADAAESGSGSKAGEASSGLEVGDAIGTALVTGEDPVICASSCHAVMAATHPHAMNKCLLTGINFLMGILVKGSRK
jgi:hypothetical protein